MTPAELAKMHGYIKGRFEGEKRAPIEEPQLPDLASLREILANLEEKQRALKTEVDQQSGSLETKTARAAELRGRIEEFGPVGAGSAEDRIRSSMTACHLSFGGSK